jgi:L-2-hydroxyglutarate oxidase LhgO
VDSHGFVAALRRDATAAGVEIVVSSPVLSGSARRDGILLSGGGAEPFTVLCRTVVNAAGLGAQSVAHSIEGLPTETVPASFFAKGHYFVFGGRSPFSRLIYPVPQPGGLGIHVTIDLGGGARFGPDVCWVDRIDYKFDPGRKAPFVDAIRQYFPGLPADRVHRDSSEARAERKRPTGLRRSRRGNSRSPRARQPVRDRIAWADRRVGPGGARAVARRVKRDAGRQR